MRRIVCTIVCGFLILLQLPGCGGAKPVPQTQASMEAANKAKSAAELKARLEDIAKDGQLNSSVIGMKSGIESLDNKELVDELLKEFSKLEAAKSKAEVTEIAKRMATKL